MLDLISGGKFMTLIQQTLNIYSARKFNVRCHDSQYNGIH